ncbi:MAG: methyltransferase domain-containing protein, partial [Candidatus Lokiarchaeota archaeon]|nr:methyltransferase domain-containing protein [Candidatus Lokiarchaeota archaeon]MBD3341593.1 methyltransferase domain-containing protein [Candidatus Lokiarchaeota archaeon]
MNDLNNQYNKLAISFEILSASSSSNLVGKVVNSKLIGLESKKSLINRDKTHQFYSFPKYYDLAFNRDVDNDIQFFIKCFKEYSDIDVQKILEPACGTGIFLENFPEYGYKILGYDLSEEMVEYSIERLNKLGINQELASTIVGNMKDLEFKSDFDAAIICINSLGYLTQEDDIISHFKVMGKSIKEGGIYIIELSCKCEDLASEKKPDDTWQVKNDGIEIKMSWIIDRYDIRNRIRHINFQMNVNDNGKNLVLEE